jgi:hypothetical protein
MCRGILALRVFTPEADAGRTGMQVSSNVSAWYECNWGIKNNVLNRDSVSVQQTIGGWWMMYCVRSRKSGPTSQGSIILLGRSPHSSRAN